MSREIAVKLPGDRYGVYVLLLRRAQHRNSYSIGRSLLQHDYSLTSTRGLLEDFVGGCLVASDKRDALLPAPLLLVSLPFRLAHLGQLLL